MKIRDDYKLLASVVIYKPNLNNLSEFLSRLSRQADKVLVVDNGSDLECKNKLEELSEKNIIEHIAQTENIGVARGHNLSIRVAMRRGCSHVLMFDQDSNIENNFVNSLKHAFYELSKKGKKIGCVGAHYISKFDGGGNVFIRRRGIFMEKIKCKDRPYKYIQSDYLITSGCLISMEAVIEAGYLDERLFIDLVDIEWGLRALSKGYKSFGVCDAKMTHGIGEGDISVPLLHKNLPSHTAIRRYYIFRNTILLWHRSYVSNLWKVRSFVGLVYRAIVYLSYEKHRTYTLRVLSKAIFHGLTNRSGKAVSTEFKN